MSTVPSGHPRAARPRRLVRGALVGLVAGGAIVTAGTLHAASANAPSHRPQLVEAPWCGHEVGSTAPAPSSASPSSQTVTVTVPATALLKVDRGAHIVAALTNTGCAPRPSDDLYVVAADGSVRRVSSPRMVNRAWQGDFRHPGTWVAQLRG